MTTIERIKWASTFCVLSGILLTNLNVYPLNIALHGTGAIGWTVAGYLAKDRAILDEFRSAIAFVHAGHFESNLRVLAETGKSANAVDTRAIMANLAQNIR